MKKRILTGLFAAALGAVALTGCGSKAADNGQAAPETQADTAEGTGSTAAEGTDAAEAKGKITIAASITPHAEILEQAKEILAGQGWELEIVTFEDYIQPNLVVESGDMDANYFQHIPYLDNFNAERGTHLVNAGGIHFEPLGIYSAAGADLNNIEEGAVIAVPNDPTNEARALMLLEANGVITLKEGAGLNATVKDIAENPHKVSIQELEAAQVARVKDEAAFLVLNGNYALLAGFNVSEALSCEEIDSEAARTYVNVIAVKEGNENSEGIQALVAALKSEAIQKYINDTYQGAVVPYTE